MGILEATSDKKIEEIVSRLKIRSLSEQGMQRGYVKRHLVEANQDISFLLTYTAALARKLSELLPEQSGLGN